MREIELDRGGATGEAERDVGREATATVPKRFMVVLPTYNERENLPLMVEALHRLGLPGLEILVVDDNSPDGTGRI
ncbi:MAG: hypothetical protein AVDCRST_MAG88-3877, partial [uncultured Thermomicrobiales bacterium]